MDAVNDPANEEIVFVASAQVGKTEIVNNIVGYFMHQDPSPMLIIQPTLDMAETWSKDRLSPMLRDTPVLSGKVKDNRQKNSGNTILHKTFPGGHLTAAGANSPASLASRPVRIFLGDEVDRYPPSAGDEGDPVSLGKKRTTTFWNRVIFLVSTPTNKGTSRIDEAWEQSDKRRYFVPCPHCGEFQYLKWSQVKFEKESPQSATYTCEVCGVLLTEADKPGMIAAGEWRATAPFTGVAGFHINELYSPWSSWGNMASEFLKVHKNPQRLKVWINTSLGEPWEEKGETVDEDSLKARREHYTPEELPADVLVLTAGVDVQNDRLECEVVGWGQDDESWSIDYKVIYGSPALGDVWETLDDYLKTSYYHPSGSRLRVAAACIDSGGHHTDQVYRFCKPRQVRRVYAVKGSSQAGQSIAGKASKTNKAKVLLFSVGTDTAKEQIYSFLKIADVGPGYCHFSHHHNDEQYFKGLTCEQAVTRYNKGHAQIVWVKPDGAANEPLDCRVYATAGREILNPNYRKLAEKLKVEPDDVDDLVATEPDDDDSTPVKKRKKAKRRRGGFVKGW